MPGCVCHPASHCPVQGEPALDIRQQAQGDRQKAITLRPQRLRLLLARMPLVADTLHRRQHVERVAGRDDDRRRQGSEGDSI